LTWFSNEVGAICRPGKGFFSIKDIGKKIQANWILDDESGCSGGSIQAQRIAADKGRSMSRD
jgi:hypothetical protein